MSFQCVIPLSLGALLDYRNHKVKVNVSLPINDLVDLWFKTAILSSPVV